MGRAQFILCFGIAFTGACAPTYGPRLVSNPDPSGKIPAIKQAAQSRDLSTAEQLVKDLSSDDPAVRFYAIEALERMTGETRGYIYYADEDARAPAVKAWRAWLAESQSAGGNVAP